MLFRSVIGAALSSFCATAVFFSPFAASFSFFWPAFFFFSFPTRFSIGMPESSRIFTTTSNFKPTSTSTPFSLMQKCLHHWDVDEAVVRICCRWWRPAAAAQISTGVWRFRTWALTSLIHSGNLSALTPLYRQLLALRHSRTALAMCWPPMRVYFPSAMERDRGKRL